MFLLQYLVKSILFIRTMVHVHIISIWRFSNNQQDIHLISQIRLSDGTRLVSKFNHTHTVGDIRNFINLSRPGAPTAYALMTTFPNKVLSEEGSSIADAGLLNACIVQRKS